MEQIKQIRPVIFTPEQLKAVTGKATCNCVYHAEQGIPCEHDLALLKRGK